MKLIIAVILATLCTVFLVAPVAADETPAVATDETTDVATEETTAEVARADYKAALDSALAAALAAALDAANARLAAAALDARAAADAAAIAYATRVARGADIDYAYDDYIAARRINFALYMGALADYNTACADAHAAYDTYDADTALDDYMAACADAQADYEAALDAWKAVADAWQVTQ